jgi:hypothetical protein
MPWSKTKTESPCVACGGTGLNSKGGVCDPCWMSGRTPKHVRDRVLANYKVEIGLMDEPPPPAKQEPVVVKPKARSAF